MMVVVMSLADPLFLRLLLRGGRLGSRLIIELFFFIRLSLFGLQIFIIVLIIIILWLLAERIRLSSKILLIIFFSFVIIGLLSIFIGEDIILSVIFLRGVAGKIFPDFIFDSSVVIVDLIVLVINVFLTESIILKHRLAKVH
jgi:hypothetical protein